MTNMKRNVFFIIAIVCLFFAVPPLDAWAEPSLPTVIASGIYANGTPLIIADSGSGDNTTTTIYIDTNGNGVVDGGELSLSEAGIDDAPLPGVDLSGYNIYGGTFETPYTGDTKITMTGGTVNTIFGGSLRTAGAVTGNTSVTMSGGQVEYIYGGGYSGGVTGSSTVVITGSAVVKECVYGGSKDSNVSANTSVSISGLADVLAVFGGNQGSDWDNKRNVGGNTEVTLTDSATVKYIYSSGGPYSTVSGDAVLNLNGGTVSGSVHGGGQTSDRDTVVGDKIVSVSGGFSALSDGIIIGGYDGVDSFSVTGNLSGASGSIVIYLPYGMDTSENPIIATDADESDLAVFTLRDPSQKGLFLRGSDIRVGDLYQLRFEEYSGENRNVIRGDTYGTLPAPGKTGYQFQGWYTEESGGTRITSDLTIEISADQTLYARWSPNTYTVAFDGNGATGGSMDSQSFTYDTAQALTANAFEKTHHTVTYDGQGGAVSPGSATSVYEFLGWETDENPSPVYSDGQSVLNLTETNGTTVTLSALWSDAPSAVTLPAPTRTGYRLNGWYTETNGGGTEAGDAGESYTPGGNITLYADWNAIPNRRVGVTAATTANIPVNSAFALDLSTIFEDAENDPLSYTVTVDGDKGNAADESYSYTPATAGTFTLVFSANDGSANSEDTYTVTLTAQQASSNNGNSGGGGTTPPPSQNVDNSTQGNTTNIGTTVTGSTEGSTATGRISSDTAGALVNNAREAENAGNKAVVEIKLETGSYIRAAEIIVPKASFDSLASGTKADLKIVTEIGTVTFDSTAVDTISAAASSGDITISMAKADITALSDSLKALVGNRPVYDFTVTAGGQTVSEFSGGKAKISLPYTPAPGEDKNAIVVYYISDSGMLMRVRGSYNETSGTVEFSTTHFSRYAVGYNKVEFRDVSDTAWYSGAVTFLAAREITGGTGDGNFSPKAKLTRGQFLVMLMRAYDIDPDENPKDNFADAGNNYQTGYLAAAKRLDISQGVGGNQFDPERSISRQEMFTLLYRALDLLGVLPEGASGKAAGDYDDSGRISAYAKDAIDAFVKAGVISGSGGKLNPSATTTRAEMAQVLYNLLIDQG